MYTTNPAGFATPRLEPNFRINRKYKELHLVRRRMARGRQNGRRFASLAATATLTMDRRFQFNHRLRSCDFVRGRPVARENTRRFFFGENCSSWTDASLSGGARPGFRRFQAAGYFGVPYASMRAAVVYRLLPIFSLSGRAVVGRN